MNARRMTPVSAGSVGIALLTLLSSLGCASTELSRLVFPQSSLPSGVHLAEWDGSDKLPWMDRNPFFTRDARIIERAEVEDGNRIPFGSVREVAFVLYEYEAANLSEEICLIGTVFQGPSQAGNAAEALRAWYQQEPRDTHNVYTVLCNGRIVCILSQEHDIPPDVQRAMVRLTESALQKER